MLDLASLSLIALFVVVLVSCTTRVNPGILAIVLAWLLAVCPPSLCDKPQGFNVKKVLEGFPTALFLTLTGVTLLFALVQDNGTLDRLTRRAVKACGGHSTIVPVLFFLVAATLGTLGAGNIAPAALIAPMAMSTARRLGIPAFPMAIMVTHGSIAGGMSPIGPAGAIVAVICREKLNLPGGEWDIYFHNLIANTIVACLGFALFGGFRRRLIANADTSSHSEPQDDALEGRHRATLGILAAVVIAVLGFGADVGMAGFAASVAMIWFRLANEGHAIRVLPWGVILMVCGVSMLTSVLELTGGTKLLTEQATAVMTPRSAPALLAVLCGVISVYSSTTGVVLPLFLPLVPSFVEKLQVDPLMLASAVVVGGNVADASPLSTIGALCLAAAGGDTDERRRLFSKLLTWGFAMPFVVATGYAATAFLGVSP